MASTVRTVVRGAYEIQRLRIQMGNRIVGNFKAKLGQAPSAPEEDLGEEEVEILKTLRKRFKKLTDGVVRFPKYDKFVGDEIISDYTDFVLLEQYVELEKSEKTHFKRLGEVLTGFPIYTEWLSKIDGIGPAMGGIIVSEINIHKVKYPASLAMYAGLDVGDDGAGRSKRKEHLVDREYTNRAGETSTRKSITFNPFLKTKLMGVLAPSFLRARNERYAKIYNDYKHRLENHIKYQEVSKGHRHQMALRYMIKIFLQDLYNAWRPLEGLEVAPKYEEAKLGHVHQDSGQRAA
jgi:Transposase IS116/IS110/IS902 family